MTEIPRPEKILIAMFQLSEGTMKALEYEDIVVKAWELFPEEFGLRKYVRKYPDSSDIHKPLYGPLKNRGFVWSGNKKFKLTDKGVTYSAELEKILKGVDSSAAPDRLSRDKETELKRICETDAFRLFASGQGDKILDTDFYAYLGTTVRTERHEFLGKLTTVEDAATDAARISQNPKFQLISQLHKFVCEKFASNIARKKGTK